MLRASDQSHAPCFGPADQPLHDLLEVLVARRRRLPAAVAAGVPMAVARVTSGLSCRLVMEAPRGGRVGSHLRNGGSGR
jgi:hypothetical protein